MGRSGQTLRLVADDEERFIAEPRRDWIERRASPREQVYLTGLVVRPDGSTFSCVIVDRSRGGFRIQTGDEAVPDRFGLIDLVAGSGYLAEAVWRNAPQAGLRRLTTYDLRAPEDEFSARMRDAWRDALA